MKKATTLVFDFGGVIINLKEEIDWLQQDLLPHFNHHKLLHLQQKGYFKDLETGKVHTSEFLHEMQNIATVEDNSTENIKKHWNAILKDIPQHRVQLLQRLKQKYNLVLLSNTNAIHVEAFQAYMHTTFGEDVLETNFHTVNYSQNIGMRKPAKEIYEFIQEQQGVKGSEIIFFDDKTENLIEPQKLGWNTVQVPYNQFSYSLIENLL